MLDATEVLPFLHHSLQARATTKSELCGEDEGFAQELSFRRLQRVAVFVAERRLNQESNRR